MTPIIHSSHNRIIGKPKDWNDEKNGECLSLGITDVEVDGLEFQVSFWKPSPEELEMLNNGKCVALGIVGTQHPVVFLSIES